MNELEKKIYDEYIKMGVWECKECQACREEEKNFSKSEFCTTGIWAVGENYCSNRILFVGKVARGDGGGKYYKDSRIFDCTESSRGYLWDNKSRNRAYWSYTKEICKNVFGSDTIENIAFTNIIKCNTSSGIDKTTEDTKRHCIEKMQVFRKELEILKPKIIIFYTGKDYDEYIFKPGIVFDECLHQPSDLPEMKSIGKKMVPWREEIMKLDDMSIFTLRTGHPERLKKADFVNSIKEYIEKHINL